ncbi:MAG TPA: ABC transporter substrate-binding protein [Geminicoccaceae bacterium]|nr:ABC transporter substrate-binding protein [Geminicoccaceae bacterium]
MRIRQSRRDFLASASLAAAAGVLGPRAALAEDGPPETTTIKLAYYGNICLSPLLIAKDLLHAEGFTDVRYVEAPESFTIPELVARGDCHFGSTFAGTVVHHVDNGVPIIGLSGLHSGCYELFAHEDFRTITQLRGKRVAIQDLNSDGHQYLSIMAAHVGLDPKTDFDWIIPPDGNALEIFAQGKADAFLAFPPEPQELRDRNIGRVIISTIQDKPWSQYLCCLLFGARDFVHSNPIATKRSLRALLKSADYCAAEPKRVAQRLTDGGFARYEYAQQTLSDIRYRGWRDYDPEDTMRFYALRLYEAGMIRTSPNRILAESTDWRFLNELKRELKS